MDIDLDSIICTYFIYAQLPCYEKIKRTIGSIEIRLPLMNTRLKAHKILLKKINCISHRVVGVVFQNRKILLLEIHIFCLVQSFGW